MLLNKLGIFDRKGEIGMQAQNLQTIKDAFPEIDIFFTYSFDELKEKGGDIDALITWPPFPALGIDGKKFSDFCVNAKNLRWIHSFTSGVELIMTPDILKSDIVVTCTKGVHGYPLADHVLAYIFAFLRSFPMLFRSQQKHEFNSAAGDFCDETYGKTVGIVGLGMIGMYVAQKCKQLGMHVVGFDLIPVENEWVDRCYTGDGLHKLLEESDFVVLNVALTRETRNMIGEKELNSMKKSAYLINVARGGIVDEEAMIKALENKTIAGAGLDVFMEEPLKKESPLWDMENVIITPHIAARSPYYMDRTTKVITDNISRYLNGEPMLFKANKTDF